MRAEELDVERRRRWSPDDKARLGAETLAPDACVSEIAHQHDVAPDLLFGWRRRARLPAPSAEPAFLPVQVGAEPVAVASSPFTKRPRKRAGTTEIDLGSGRRLTVGADVDAVALALVLDVLERR